MADNFDNPDKINAFKGIKESFSELISPLENATNAFGNLQKQFESVNSAFLLGKTRIEEIMDAVSRTASGVIRLGGSVSDVSKTIIDIADGARRNVLATEEQVTELYAASTILNTSSEYLVNNFAEAGYEVSQIGVNLENSIQYVQSVGLNAKTVVKDVANNMELMNRFNFNNGVQGLTKMAAQASMLRFDMNRTAEFADKVMSPEGAIEAAAGFQRLGVSVGNLVDPFALMNDSINDPGALQDSIIKATKQYTEFDEKTKSFKINPQGIRMLKELADVTNISAKELSKTALAAADLDRRLSEINPSLQFDKEEDRQLLANMATMKDNEYVVQLKDDETGRVEQRKLSDITQEEFTKLRKQQENAPKTLEEIQFSQLDTLKQIETSIKSISAKIGYGLANSAIIRNNVAGGVRLTQNLASSFDRNSFKTTQVTEFIDNAVGKITDITNKISSGKLSDKEGQMEIEKLKNSFKSNFSSLVKGTKDSIKNVLKETISTNTGTSNLEKEYGKVATELLNSIENIEKSKKPIKQESIIKPTSRYDDLYLKTLSSNNENKTKTKEINSQIDLGGTITIKVDAPVGVSEKYFKEFFETPEFKRKIYEYYNQKAKELERV